MLLVFHYLDWVAGQPEHAYIAESLRQFPDRDRLPGIFDHAGFDLLERRPCFGGMLAILLLRKRETVSDEIGNQLRSDPV